MIILLHSSELDSIFPSKILTCVANMTPQATAYTGYCVHRLLHTQATAYTDYCIRRLLHTQTTAYTGYCVHRLLHTQATAYTDYCIHRLRIHRLLHIQTTAYTDAMVRTRCIWCPPLRVQSSNPQAIKESRKPTVKQ